MLVYQRVTFFFGFGTRPCGAKSVSFGEAVQSARHRREWTSRIAWYVQCIVDSTYFLSEINIWVDQILRNNNYTKSHIKKNYCGKFSRHFTFVEVDFESTQVFTVPISSITDALHPPRDKVMAAANVGGFAEASRCFTQSRSFPWMMTVLMGSKSNMSRTYLVGSLEHGFYIFPYIGNIYWE